MGEFVFQMGRASFLSWGGVGGGGGGIGFDGGFLKKIIEWGGTPLAPPPLWETLHIATNVNYI